MKDFIKIISLLKSYKKDAFLNVFFNLISTILGLFSIAMLAPMLDILFNQRDKAKETLEVNVITSPLQDGYSVSEHLNYILTELITQYDSKTVLIYICAISLGSIMLKNVTRYLALYFMASVRNGIVKDFRNLIYVKILHLPISYFSDEKKGNIISKITNDLKEIEWSALKSLEASFRDPIQIFIYFGMLIFMSPKLTLFVIVFLPISAVIISMITKSLKKSAKESQQKLGHLISSVEETLTGLKVIKGFNNERVFESRFETENDSYTRSMNTMLRKVDLASPVSETLGIATITTVLWFGGNLVLEGELLAALFIPYLVFLTQLITPFKSLTTSFSNIKRASASLDRISEITDAEINIKDSSTSIKIKPFEKGIEYKNVSFKYNKDYVLKHVNFSIEKGKTIALVGASGSGKSTISDLLPRFYDVNEGEILIDGINIKDASLISLRDQLGIVTQQSILFNDTVFNNIAFGLDATEDEVINAAKIANAHEFIKDLEKGYYTNIGDGGGKLSGGQKQRLSIARAILKNPEILILDEATSALDTESEKLVQNALENLMRNRTSIVVAHRLSTIQHADEILVLEKGEIIERGTHADLIIQNGTYKKLIDLQGFK